MKKKRKLWYVLSVLCVLWILPPQKASAQDAISVNGVNIMQQANYTVECGDGTAVYDPGTKVLTLENAVIGKDKTLTYGIEIGTEGVTLELKGTNTIEAYMGISSESPLRIQGVEGGSLAIDSWRNEALWSPCCGIRMDKGGLTIQDADLQVKVHGLTDDVSGFALYITGGDNSVINSRIGIEGDPVIRGINATEANSLTIDNSQIEMLSEIRGGVEVTGTLNLSSGKVVIASAKEFGITAGEINITAGAEVNVATNAGLAISANNGITISSSKVEAESKTTNSILCNELEVKDNAEVTAKGYLPAFFVTKNTLLENALVTAVSNEDVGIFNKEGDLKIIDSKVEALSEAGMAGILTKGNLTLQDSEVISPGKEGGAGIKATGAIFISGGTTEIGKGSLTAGGDVSVGGNITSEGVPSFDKVNGSGGGVTFAPADYKEVDNAVAEANALNPEDYISFQDVEDAVNAVVRGKDFREQDLVNQYAEAIRAALADLMYVFQIAEGGNQTAVLGENSSIVIKVDQELGRFTGVSIDGVKLSQDSYTVVSGSTVVSLKPEYVNTLTAGTHKVIIHFTDGQAETGLTVKEKEEENPGTPEKPDTENKGTPENPDTENP